MQSLIRAFHYWLYEPSIWLLRCFFQPAGFKKDFETDSLRDRMRTIARLILPMFLGSYLPALVIRVVLYVLFPSVYPDYHIPGSVIWHPGAALFVFDATWATAASCIIGGFFGGFFGVTYGIAFALAAAIGNGIIVNNMDETTVSIVWGISCGLVLGLTFNNISAIRRSGLRITTIGIILGIFYGMLIGVLVSTFNGYWVGRIVGVVGGPALQNSDGIEGSIAGTIASAFIAALLVYVTGNIVRSSVRGHSEVVEVATRIGIAVAAAFGAAVGIPTGDVGMHLQSTTDAITTGLNEGMIAGIAFLLSYLPSYFRLPLYPLSALSVVRSYYKSQREPLHVFQHLHHCALCCDECVFLPLPYVKQLLLIAASQDVERTLEEIDFILQERPQQRSGAQDAALEIALYDLSMRESLRDISRAHQRMAVMLPQEIRLTDLPIARLFRYLDDASRDAMSYYSRINLQTRREALESMLANLKKVHTTAAFRDASLNRRLEEVVQKWRAVARHEQENVKRASANLRLIENPYTPGLVLELRDPLFVGRQDLAQQLGEALRRPRRPTFFLTGERRMGKSSVLKQLPDLLGSQYLPVFYDLQSTGVASSTAALFAAIAEGIYELLTTKGMQVRALSYEQLREDQRENEAVVYHSFNRWLKEVERVLEYEDRVLMLTFDEFEKLEEAGQKGHLDLMLLLDWLRSIIQNRPRVALLFSGVKTVSDMGSNWSGYFVNVETLKVSFLHAQEARRLIVHPVEHFPGEHVFSEDVVSEIVHVTGCHPFLVQAICSIIIAHLNEQGRQRAVPGDVKLAIDEAFQRWEDNYFNDLWARTDADQRSCLHVIRQHGQCQFSSIQRQCGLDAASTHRALQKLVKRDIVLAEQETYRIAAPLFELWVERSISIP